MSRKIERREGPKLNWKRTGVTSQELSHNKKGVITLATEKAGNRTRQVQVGYKSVEVKPKDS